MYLMSVKRNLKLVFFYLSNLKENPLPRKLLPVDQSTFETIASTLFG